MLNLIIFLCDKFCIFVENLHLEVESTNMNYKILYVFFSFIFLFSSCDFDISKGISAFCTNTPSNIKEAKKQNVFIAEYKPVFVEINDSIKFQVMEAWVEKVFFEQDLDETGKVKKSFKAPTGCLLFTIKGNMQKKYRGFDHNWEFENAFIVAPNSIPSKYNTFLCSQGDISLDAIPDSIEIKLIYSIPSDNPDEFDIVKPLGHFYLYKE